ncbi:MAG: FAD-dependent monooxygenase [Pseudomonadota bacterium]
MRAVIVGAGIGGLCTGLSLQRKGWTVRILEQAPQLTEVGAGIQLSPNACRVLLKLDVLDAIRVNAVAPRALELRTGINGHSVFEIELDQSREAPYLHSHRADLVAALQARLLENDANSLRLNQRVGAYENDGNGVRVTTHDKQVHRAELVVGAGGLHCPVRRQMHGSATPIDTGHCAWRAVVPTSEIDHLSLPDSACVWTGANKHAVSYRIRNGELVNLVAVVESRPGAAESWSQLGNKQDTLADFAGWQPIVLDLIRKAPTLHKWALFERPPLSAWHDGQVGLLGDACHPMLPFMAQGAAMAIEDAWQLARSLQNQSTIEYALADYFSKRIQRTLRVQSLARNNAKIFHRQNLFAKAATYAPLWLAGRLAPMTIKQQLAWLYEFDITQ